MINLSEHYQYLLLGKVTGTLTASEEIELNTLFAEDAEIKAAYSELTENLPTEYVANSFSHLHNPAYWSVLDEKYATKTYKLTWIKVAAAALVIGIIGTALFFFNSNENNEELRAVKQQPEIIQLKLANGKLIDLSNQEGKIKEGSTALLNDNNSLTYQAGNNVENGINSIIVPSGMDYKITLSDGSKVWMNSETKLDFPFNFSGPKREITISGEAYLEVAKNSHQPFIVNLPNSRVQVLGTEFNVNTYDSSNIKVALVSGRVNLSGGNKTIQLHPGKQGTFTNAKILYDQPFDSKTVLSWQKGLFYFEEADVVQISKVIERWFGLTSKFDNPEIIKMKFAGVLNKNQPIEAFLDDLKAISKIEGYIDKDGILHFK